MTNEMLLLLAADRIHTTNARSHLKFPGLLKHYGWSDGRTFEEIQHMLSNLLDSMRAANSP